MKRWQTTVSDCHTEVDNSSLWSFLQGGSMMRG